MKTLYARALVPFDVDPSQFANRHADYAPWIVAHERKEMLENDHLDIMWRTFDASLDDEDPNSLFEEFMEFLENQGYVVLYTYTGGVWSPEE
jgi:hypothetical protein